MLLILSPAKSLNFNENSGFDSSEVRFSNESELIVQELIKYSKPELEKLMKISSKLADLNYSRFREWVWPHPEEVSKQALLAFDGDVYDGMDTSTFSYKNLEFAQKSIRILSGLYGVLRPLDRIMAYRLEMGSPLSVAGKKNLYQFWGEKIARLIESDMKANNQSVLLNLASNEYSKAVLPHLDKSIRVISCDFREQKGDKLQMVSFYAKKARGMMSRFIIDHEISNPEYLQGFTDGGYLFKKELSTESTLMFVR
jgi:hypothetical protein